MRHVGNRAGTARTTTWAAVVAIGLVGTVLVGVGVKGEAPPPSPPASAAAAAMPSPEAASPSPSTSAPSSKKATPKTSTPAPRPTKAKEMVMKKSHPVRLTVPAIDVDTPLMDVGLQADGSIGVPPLGPDSPAGWYDRGPTPGEKGPAVILGHVTAISQEGPAVFFKLGALRKNDKISVTRADGQVAVFTVTRIVQVPKPDFSSMDTYGNTEGAELRLITCGGEFNKSVGRHADNIIVHAKLTSHHAA
ncbi:class F sortase [Arthrobacter sp. JSM 101049]|uniref:class F sortase n=1 Tax=Arthrobacter sp. JSM 101049 TaxID=929097 RepID=UPI003562E41E